MGVGREAPLHHSGDSPESGVPRKYMGERANAPPQAHSNPEVVILMADSYFHGGECSWIIPLAVQMARVTVQERAKDKYVQKQVFWGGADFFSLEWPHSSSRLLNRCGHLAEPHLGGLRQP